MSLSKFLLFSKWSDILLLDLPQIYNLSPHNLPWGTILIRPHPEQHSVSQRHRAKQPPVPRTSVRDVTTGARTPHLQLWMHFSTINLPAILGDTPHILASSSWLTSSLHGGTQTARGCFPSVFISPHQNRGTTAGISMCTLPKIILCNQVHGRCAGQGKTEAPWSSESMTHLVCPGWFI